MSLTEDAIERIKGMIVAGELRPGDRLPIEPELAAHLGLSRNSLREATRALVALNILESRQGAGTFVTSLEPGLLFRSVNFVLSLQSKDSSLEFLEVRRLLETEAAGRAATRVSDADVARMRELNAQVREIAAQPEFDTAAFLRVDEELHQLFAERSGNAALAAMVGLVGGRTGHARVIRVVVNPGTAEQAVAEHDAVIDALALHDPERARVRMASHIQNLEDWVASDSPDEVWPPAAAPATES
jgi:GntR family transcriptional regulator, transcriptional repressor for pyruvate dehydrogenase complex